MNSRLLKPSELKSLLTLTDSLHYKFQNFIGDGSFPRTVLLEDTDNGHEVVGKVVTSYNWGEFCLWPKLQHASLNPLLQMLSIGSDMTIFLCPSTGKSLKLFIEEVSFVQHPKCFDRKKGYARDVLRGLEYLHQNSICLMNLTEENVLISCTSDIAVISDFSCAICVTGNAKVKCSMLSVSPLPPEARMMDAIDCMPFDIWTCGVTFLQMFTRHVLPWCSLVIDLLDGLEIELLRRTNASSYLKDDAATALKEFLRPFLVFEPKLRVSAEAAFASLYLQDSCNRLDEPAREFWKKYDVSQFSPKSQLSGDSDMKKTLLQNELPLRFSYLKGLPQGKSAQNKRLHYVEWEKKQAKTDDTGCVQIFASNQPNPNCISVSSELNEVSNKLTSGTTSDSSNNIGYTVFSSDNNGNNKLNVETLQEKHNQDRVFGSENFPKVNELVSSELNEISNKLTSGTTSDSFNNVGCTVFSGDNYGNNKLNEETLQEKHNQDRVFGSENFPKVNELVSSELNEISNKLTSGTTSDSFNNVGCTVFSGDNYGNNKLNEETLQEKHNQDRVFGSESFPKVNERQKKLTLLTSSVPNFERTVATKNVPFLNSLEANSSTLNLEDLNLGEERPCRISGMSSSIEVIASVNQKESDPTLVLHCCDHKTNEAICRSTVVPLPWNEDKANSEPQVHGQGGFLHNTSEPENKVNTSESAMAAFSGSLNLGLRKDAMVRNKCASIWPGSLPDASSRSPWIDTEDAMSHSAAEDIAGSETFRCNSDGRSVSKSATTSKEAATALGKRLTDPVLPFRIVHRPCHSSWLTSAEEIAQNATKQTTEGNSKCTEKRMVNKMASEKTLSKQSVFTNQSGVIDVSMDIPLFSEDMTNKRYPGTSQRKSKKRWLRVLCPRSKAWRKSKNKLSKEGETQ